MIFQPTYLALEVEASSFCFNDANIEAVSLISLNLVSFVRLLHCISAMNTFSFSCDKFS